MRAKEPLDRIRVRPFRVGGNDGIEELDEPLGGARREAVDRVSDDVGMDMLGQVKADRKAARARTLRVVVGNLGIPAKSEKRTVTGVELRLRCGARVRNAASPEGVNVPLSSMPFACAGLNPGWTPPLASSNTSMVSRLMAKSFSSVVSGMARSSVR
jgi:hypothetical protein